MPPANLPSDTERLLEEVRRFCQRTVRPLVENTGGQLDLWHRDGEQLATIIDTAETLGLLDLFGTTGLGLWADSGEEADGSASNVPFSVQALRLIAAEDASLAYHFHQRGLACFLGHQFDVESERFTTAICLQGRFGLARHSLARLLQQKSLTDDDIAVLQDYFVAPVAVGDEGNSRAGRDKCPLLFTAAEDWRRLLATCFDAAGRSLQWIAFSRDRLTDVEPLPASHGLDGTPTWQWHPSDEKPLIVHPNAERSLSLYSQSLHREALALVAIGLGTLDRADAMAREYAATRIQGGKKIEEHPAVQRLLANLRSTINTVDAMLRQAATLDSTPAAGNLATIFSIRAQAHPLLCAAANDAMQVFGGIGYVRETGIEQIVRDNNHLRQLLGTPEELRLFIAAWEDGHR